MRVPPMDQPKADNAEPERRAAKTLDRIRKRLRRSARRNREAIEGAACMLGLLIGIVLGAIVSQEAPAGHVFEEGLAGAASLPFPEPPPAARVRKGGNG